MAKVLPIRVAVAPIEYDHLSKGPKLVPTHKCAICGGTKAASKKTPLLCANLCTWTLEGWIGFNPKGGDRGEGKVVFTHPLALKVAAKQRISYPKTVALARALGWNGDINATTTMKPIQTFTTAAARVAARKWTGMSQTFFSTTASKYFEVQ